MRPAIGQRKGWQSLCIALILGWQIDAARCLALEEVRLHTIDGALCMRVKISSGKSEIPAYLLLDLGSRAPLLLHKQTAGALGLHDRDPVEIVFEETGFRLSGVQSVPRSIELLEKITTEHADELDNIPAVGILGMPALEGWHICLRLKESRLQLATNDADFALAAGGFELPMVTRDHGYWFDVQAPGGQKLKARLGSVETDTRIEQHLPERLHLAQQPSAAFLMGGLELSKFAALRPSDFTEIPEPRPDVTLGTGLLSCFTIVFAPLEGKTTWKAASPPSPAVEAGDLKLFTAFVRGNDREIESFLTSNPTHRLAADASAALLDTRLEKTPLNNGEVRVALEWAGKTAAPARRAQTLLNAADDLCERGRNNDAFYDLADAAVTLANQYVTADPDDAAIHRLNARRGLIALRREKLDEARRFLLSAAFAMPKDPYVNLYLGELYQASGQPARAWSRYLESVLAPSPPRRAMLSLDRLNRNKSFRRTFTMNDAETLLEGRVVSFVPGEAPEEKSNVKPQLRLIELFVNSDEKTTQAAELAFDGLRSYWQDAPVILVQHHVKDFLGSQLCEHRARFYQFERTPAAYFNGQGPCTEGGDDKAVSQVFSSYLDKVRETESPSAIVISGEASLEGGDILFRAGVQAGSGIKARAHAWLIESSVMAIGENQQVMHHCVVRGALSPPDGWPIDQASKTLNARVELESLSEALDSYIEALEKERDGESPMRPTFIDPAACQVLVFAQDVDTRKILGAIVLPLTAEVRKSL